MEKSLKEKFEHDRDGYTAAKGDVIMKATVAARDEFGDKYMPKNNKIWCVLYEEKTNMCKIKSLCGINCGKCSLKETCEGCSETCGKPFGGECMIAKCCQNKGYVCCTECSDKPCSLKEQLVSEFNALGINDMAEVTDLNALKGSFVNLEYTLPSGQTMKLWDDDRIYLGNQICKANSDRCYGLTADENYLLVCEYGENGTDAEITVYQKRRNHLE